MMLADDEAKLLAKALADLEAQFPTHVDPRALALVQFGAIAAGVYLPRIIAMRMRGAEEKAQRRQNKARNVTPVTEAFSPDQFAGGFDGFAGSTN